jgi:hypothetical protein
MRTFKRTSIHMQHSQTYIYTPYVMGSARDGLRTYLVLLVDIGPCRYQRGYDFKAAFINGQVKWRLAIL